MERLDLDADVLHAARALAESQGRSLGQVISDLVRRGRAAWPDDVTIVNNFSSIPTFPPDRDAFPLFDQAIYATVELEAGECLYIPRRWWVWDRALDRNVALQVWHAADRTTASLPADRSDFAEVSRVEDVGFAGRSFARKEPAVVLSAEVRGWPAMAKWTDEYLTAASGDRRHFVGVSPDNHLHATRGDHRTRLEAVTLPELIRRGREGSEYLYLAQNDAMPRLLAADWSVPGFWKACFGDEQFRVPFSFCFGGGEGVLAPLHFDYYETLLVQIAGRKRVVLFSPSQTPYLYRKQQQLLAP
jgi:hypothetical protein